MYPFPMNTTPYPNQSAAFEGNWPFNYSNCLTWFPAGHQAGSLNQSTPSAVNSIVGNNIISTPKDMVPNANVKASVGSEKANFSEEISLKLSSLLTAMSNMQKPTSEQCDQKLILHSHPIDKAEQERDCMIDENNLGGPDVLDNSTVSQNVTVR